MAESRAPVHEVSTVAHLSGRSRDERLVARAEAPASAGSRGLTATQQTLLALLSPAATSIPIADNTDWEELQLLADRLWLGARLAGLVTSQQRIPESLRKHWMQARTATLARNLFLQSEETRLRELLVKAGVEAIPLKGTSLARILTGDLAARPVTDIDLGLRSADMARSAAVLRSAGYEVLLPEALLARRSFLNGTDEHTSEVKCTRNAAGMDVVVELHWKWMPLPERVIWSSLKDYHQAGVRTLCPEQYLLFLCSHLAGGGWAGLRWLCDVADFLTTLAPQMDAARFIGLARQARLRRAVGITLALVDDFFTMRHSAFDLLLDAAARRAAQPYRLRPFQPFLTGTRAGIHRDRLRIQDNTWQRTCYAGRLLRPTHLEWLTQQGSVRPAALAWAVRAGRLAQLFSSAGGAR